MTPLRRASPNHGDRRAGLRPELVVIHYTAMQTAQDALDRLCDPAFEVSAHYLIARNGTLWQLVAEDRRAWHAGAGSWQGRGDVNSRSIGIELDNPGSHPFSEPQMAVLEQLLSQIQQRWAIPPSGVIGHSDMAPGRKVDPGPHFDWARLDRAGLAQPPKARRSSKDLNDFRRLATEAGYPDDISDAALLAAVRLRLRPHATGILHPDDLAALAPSASFSF